MDLKKIERKLSPTDSVDGMVAYIKQSLKSFYNVHKASIENYDKWKINCEKEEYLKNPQFKIYEIKNRKSFNTLVANVKWKFPYEGKLLEDKCTLVYLGTVEKFPTKEKDEQLNKDINSIIRKHFLEKSPLYLFDSVDLNKMKYNVELYYYWKSKLVELEYRLSPVFYCSQSKKDKPEQIIINIKWGFEMSGKENKPRYILKRFNLDKGYVENTDNIDSDNILKQVSIAHISKIAPIFFNPPQK
jgi:hypothetical protein